MVGRARSVKGFCCDECLGSLKEYFAGRRGTRILYQEKISDEKENPEN